VSYHAKNDAARALALTRLQRCLASDCEGAARIPVGVVGAFARGVNAHWQPRYLYPEIAGYWLRWASARSDVPIELGERVVASMATMQQADGLWPTRVPLESESDLASRYVTTRYLFDHAMLCDGLFLWGQRRGSPRALALSATVRASVSQFISHESNPPRRIVAVLGEGAGRWSGQAGPFLLKALSRINAMNRSTIDASHDVFNEAVATLASSTLHTPHAEAHPQLYAIEGLLALGMRDEAQIAFERLLSAHGSPVELREAVGCGPSRSDVLAQALRVALILAPDETRDSGAWRAVVDELVARVDATGHIVFAAGADDSPTWAALFTEQALTWFAGDAPDAAAIV
jgi:hypothetical protein